MAEHFTEDEQVEALKKWWKENGTAIFIGIIIGLGGVVGWRYWLSHKETRAIAASDAYNSYTEALGKKDLTNAQKLANTLLEEYKGTSYAALTALELAKEEVAANKLAEAEKHLRWAMENPGTKTISLIARQRLAKVLFAEKKLDQALAVLNEVKDQTFDPRFALVRGDILHKQGKIEQAREAYQLGLTDQTLTGKEREFVEMKLDNLPKPALSDNKQ